MTPSANINEQSVQTSPTGLVATSWDVGSHSGEAADGPITQQIRGRQLRRWRTTGLAGLTALGLGACTTHLHSTAVLDNGAVHKGYAYKLPHVTYDIEITRVLSSCPSMTDHRLTFDATAKAVASTIGDEDLVISYEDLINGAKTTDLTLESYPSGLLKSVNVQVEDRTAAIAKGAIEAGVSIAKMVIGLPTPLGRSETLPGAPGERELRALTNARPPLVVWVACRPSVEKLLNGLPVLAAVRKNTAAAAKQAAKAFDDFQADHPEAPRSDKVNTKSSELASARRKAQGLADDASEAYFGALAKLTLVSRLKLDPGRVDALRTNLAQATDGAVQPQDLLEVRGDASDRHLAAPLGPGLTAPTKEAVQVLAGSYTPAEAKSRRTKSRTNGVVANSAFPSTVSDLLRAQDAEAMSEGAASLNLEFPDADVVARVAPIAMMLQSPSETLGKPVAGKPLTDKSRDQDLVRESLTTCQAKTNPCGIVYRLAAPARLQICKKPDDGDASPDACWKRLPKDGTVLFSEERTIPQYGPFASLSLKNGVLTNTTLTAEFMEDGTLVKFGYKKPTAQIEQAVGVVNEGLGGAQSVLEYQSGAALRQTQAQKTFNDALLAEKASSAALQPSDVTKTDNETALVEAQTKKIKQQIELSKAQKELDGLTGASTASP